jgi:arginyl-tRNA synthetase
MRIQDQVAPLIVEAISAAQREGDLPPFDLPAASAIPLERPKSDEHGDIATPVAMQLAREARRAPRQIAEALARRLPAGPGAMIASAEVAGTGFLNLRLAPAWLAARVDLVLAAGPAYANPRLGQGKRAQVEFVSANPTGPLTVGHGRGAVIGDTLANILAAGGYTVDREYYFNDGGLQMKNLAQSVRVRAQQAAGEAVDLPENHYSGGYIVDIAQELAGRLGAASVISADWTVLRDAAVRVIFADIQHTLERLGVRMDAYFNEIALFDRSRQPNIWSVLEDLRAHDLAYDAEGAVWFRATAFGADKDRVIVRSSGDPTYRLPDIAYHIDKLKRGYDTVVDVLGADHIAEFPDIAAAIAALGWDSTKLHIVVNQFVTLLRHGEVVKMSTRKATYVTLDELIDEVGTDAVRYFMNSRTAGSHFEFDLDLAKEAGEKNPAIYIQYAHARTAGILERRAAAKGVVYDDAADVALLTHPSELALIKQVLRLEDTLMQCIEQLEPHHLTYYATDLATAFAAFYRDCRVLDPGTPLPLAQSRLKLVRATQIALARALELLGMHAPMEM